MELYPWGALVWTFEDYLYTGVMEDPSELFNETRDVGTEMNTVIL